MGLEWRIFFPLYSKEQESSKTFHNPEVLPSIIDLIKTIGIVSSDCEEIRTDYYIILEDVNFGLKFRNGKKKTKIELKVRQETKEDGSEYWNKIIKDKCKGLNQLTKVLKKNETIYSKACLEQLKKTPEPIVCSVTKRRYTFVYEGMLGEQTDLLISFPKFPSLVPQSYRSICIESVMSHTFKEKLKGFMNEVSSYVSNCLNKSFLIKPMGYPEFLYGIAKEHTEIISLFNKA